MAFVHFHRLGALGDGFVLADAETDRVLGAGDVSARKAGARVRTPAGRRERRAVRVCARH